jgi:Rieske Fe-S protein
MAGILTAFTAMVVGPLIPYIIPPPPKGQTKKGINVTLDKALNSLKPGDAVKADAPKNTAFIMKTGGGQNAPGNLAFSAYLVREENGKISCFAVNCSHLGCSVAINSNAKRFDCPCHGSRFKLNGDVLQGPAAAPLARLDFKPGSQPNQVTIDGQTLGQGV